jgi:hypothetical protein
MSQAASYGRSFLLQSPARFHTRRRQDATSSDTSDARSVPDHPLQSANVTVKKALKPRAASLTRCFVHAMFTRVTRCETPLQTHSAFARVRVKSARVCCLTDPPGPLPTYENRFEI